MPTRTYALLVGINDYGPEVGPLDGCVADVDRVHDYLREHVDPDTLAVEVLKDADATRANVIDRVRGHLGRARAGDVALFQFCGHGARWASNAAFREFYPDGRDEGLVCADSRRPGGYDLADKELAVLIDEVARHDAHVAVLLDCCHSGSGTRGADAFRGLRPRLTHEVTTERPLESYLDGHYAALRASGQPLTIPAARHILLAACERGQLAQESAGHGIFTATLFDVLEKSGGVLSYADLFVRCRAAVRSRAYDQDPQFEAYGRFDAHSGFLAREVARGSRRRYLVACSEAGVWTVECGALTGVPTAPDTVPTLALFEEDGGTAPVGTARVVRVGADRSDIALDFDGAESRRYMGEITSLPAAPLPVAFAGEAEARRAVQEVFDAHGVAVQLVGALDATPYVLDAGDNRVTLRTAPNAPAIAVARVTGEGPAGAAEALAPVVQQVAAWERSLALKNPRTAMDATLVDFIYADGPDPQSAHDVVDGAVTLDAVREGGEWLPIRGRFLARNRTGQRLHLVLAYFSEAYGVHVLHNEPIEPGAGWTTLWGTGPDDYFYLPDGVDESRERFKLIVSTEKLDDFLVAQQDLVLGAEHGSTRAVGTVAPRRTVHTNEWFTNDIGIRVVRRVDAVGVDDAAVADGRLVIKGHPALTANISLGRAPAASRGAGAGTGFHRALADRGLTLVNFAAAGGRSAVTGIVDRDLSVLELSDIRNADTLREHPMELVVQVPLEAGEAILPVVFDGEHVLLGGAPRTDDDGTTRILIDHVPEAADGRRSLGGSLKLFFFKTVLRRDAVNKLRWVDFRADGTIAHQSHDVAAKVAGARRVLLLVHGITGDTEGMAEGVRACGLDRQFDVVLAYDYENLATPIGETARALKAQLDGVGLREGDDTHLTLLVHSMGGLVSRWFIEREGGHRVVDHLVMCGTPNHGSPLGRVDDARKVLSVLMTMAMNYLPAFVPHLGPALFVLNGSKKLTPTLEQMHPASEFIRALNDSEDPGIPYTILAGDVAAYQEAGDALFAKLVAKAGRSVVFDVLFAEQANDIAVGVESILGVSGARRLPPVRRNVACHHMNYFVSAPGQQALRTVAW